MGFKPLNLWCAASTIVISLSFYGLCVASGGQSTKGKGAALERMTESQYLLCYIFFGALLVGLINLLARFVWWIWIERPDRRQAKLIAPPVAR